MCTREHQGRKRIPGAATRSIQANFGDYLSSVVTTSGGQEAKESHIENPSFKDGLVSVTCGSEPDGPPCTK